MYFKEFGLTLKIQSVVLEKTLENIYLNYKRGGEETLSKELEIEYKVNNLQVFGKRQKYKKQSRN